MSNKTTDDSKPTCRVVGAGSEFIGKNAHLYAPGISAQSVGARRIHLQIVRIPPRGQAKAHKHDGHETAVHILRGESGMWYGERLLQHLVARAGDFLFIPADMPHLPYNLSNAENCVAIIARTDPKHPESVVLLPELDSAATRCGLPARGSRRVSTKCKSLRSELGGSWLVGLRFAPLVQEEQEMDGPDRQNTPSTGRSTPWPRLETGR
jgi:uncharacterized RmlC-like cupin family protein